jgi:uncharacterized protein (DUF983 family)
MKQTGVVRSALIGLCPCCGMGKLFCGLLSVAPRCKACGLDYAVFDPGDGPAPFVILIIGAIVVGAALWVEFTFAPPLWVHAVLWIPAITILAIALLRFIKGLLIVLQYRHQAGEGRISPP